jgi:hypothetical protein
MDPKNLGKSPLQLVQNRQGRIGQDTLRKIIYFFWEIGLGDAKAMGGHFMANKRL